MKLRTLILLYSEGYQNFSDTLPPSIPMMKILVDASIIPIFRVNKVPLLIIYRGLKEKRRIYGTDSIRTFLNEKFISL